MDKLDELIEERDEIRRKEREIARLIKLERSRAAAERKRSAKTGRKADITMDELKELKHQNTRLRQINAALLKESGLTYKQLAERLECSPSRAREIVEKQIAIMRGSLRMCGEQ